MKCQKVQRQLSAYVDNELDSVEKENIDNHIHTCPHCKQALVLLNDTWDLLNIIDKPRAAPFLYTRIMARIGEQETRKKLRIIDRVLLPITVVAVVVLGILVGGMVSRKGELKNSDLIVRVESVSSVYLNNVESDSNASIGDAYLDLAYQELSGEEIER